MLCWQLWQPVTSFVTKYSANLYGQTFRALDSLTRVRIVGLWEYILLSSLAIWDWLIPDLMDKSSWLIPSLRLKYFIYNTSFDKNRHYYNIFVLLCRKYSWHECQTQFIIITRRKKVNTCLIIWYNRTNVLHGGN